MVDLTFDLIQNNYDQVLDGFKHSVSRNYFREVLDRCPQGAIPASHLSFSRGVVHRISEQLLLNLGENTDEWKEVDHVTHWLDNQIHELRARAYGCRFVSHDKATRRDPHLFALNDPIKADALAGFFAHLGKKASKPAFQRLVVEMSEQRRRWSRDDDTGPMVEVLQEISHYVVDLELCADIWTPKTRKIAGFDLPEVGGEVIGRLIPSHLGGVLVKHVCKATLDNVLPVALKKPLMEWQIRRTEKALTDTIIDYLDLRPEHDID